MSPNNTLYQSKFGLYLETHGVLKNGGDFYEKSLNGEIMIGGINPQFYIKSPSPFTYVNILEPYDRWHFILDE